MKKTLLLAAVVGLVGCSSVPTAIKLPPDQVAGFYQTDAAAKTKAVAYFTCGRVTLESWAGRKEYDASSCEYIVNGAAYKSLDKGTVGRLVVSPGTYQITQTAGTGETSVPLNLDLKAGDVVLVKAHFGMKSGAMGGALTANYVRSVDYDKEGVLAQVKGKQPVLMEPAPEAK